VFPIRSIAWMLSISGKDPRREQLLAATSPGDPSERHLLEEGARFDTRTWYKKEASRVRRVPLISKSDIVE